MDDPLQTVVMDPRGDVVLRVGRNDTPPRTFLVNSRVLSLASPVFATMFDGRFAEGQGLSATTSREVSLPIDDPEVMETLLNIAHMCADKLTKKMDLIHFANFAILCDKYDCVGTVRMCSRTWATELLKNPKHTQFERLIFATYVLDLPVEFYQSTRLLILHRRVLKATAIVHDSRFMPLIILDKLNQVMHALQQSILKDAIFHQDIVDVFKWNEHCDNREHQIYTLFKHLVLAGLTSTMAKPITQLEKFIPKCHGLEYMGCLYECCPCRDLPTTNRRIEDELNRLAKKTEGLCLDCIQCEVTGKKQSTCRVLHK